jgi:hypothetical protein
MLGLSGLVLQVQSRLPAILPLSGLIIEHFHKAVLRA